MNTTIENTTATATGVKRVRRRTAAPIVVPASTEEAAELLAKRPSSEITRLVFMALLGCAACLALVGVVFQANNESTSPDAPPPVVIPELTD